MASVRPSVCPSVRPLCYLLLNHWTKFIQIRCVSYSHEWGAQRNFFLALPPGALGRDQKVKYHLISTTKSISKILFQTLCVFSQMKDTKHIRRAFYSVAWVIPRGGTWGYLGAKIKFRPAVCPLCYLLLNHWTKFNQIWCVTYSHEFIYWGAQRKNFLAPPPGALGRGKKVKYHLISTTMSVSKIFIPNFVYVLINERYKTYQTFYLFCCLGHALGVGLGGT